ncbi:hypothetical protein Q7P37_002612 [Cladosporium fusiforme]
MSTFASSFWSTDYAAGLGVLFGKLQQGVQENTQLITVARMRAEAEDAYGTKLGDIEAATNRIAGGFQKDDGASVKKAYEGVRTEMSEASRNHRKIASNIRELVINPFSRWCDQHAARVQNSQDDLHNRVKAHDRQAETVRQYRSAYFNKCRRVEDLDEEEKLAFQDPNSAAATGSPKPGHQSVPSIKIEEEEESDEEPEPIDIGDETYQPEHVKRILVHMLDHIRLGETKVPILGTYQNVSTGADIVEYVQKYMGATSLPYAERIGQDLVNNGFLRLIGNMGNTFANSSRMNYQWRPKVFQITGIPDKRSKPLSRASTVTSMDSNPDSPSMGAMGEYLDRWNPLNNAHPNETPAEKLRREAKEADERYKAAVRKLDGLRCNLEEAIIDHLKFMERCEVDRIKAIKAVILDFSGAVSNVIPSLQSTVDNMMLYQETVQPLGDVRYLLENYRTGSYIPKVTIYENYYNTVDEQTFGVDIEARARSDRKRVPLMVTTILTFLDNQYPELEGDEARRKIWLVDVPLGATHHLRGLLNTGKPVPQALLDKYEVPIVASVLKLYLLELPDSLVSSHVYEIVKTIYSSTAQTASESARVQVIQSTLGQLRLANIATLDAIVSHFARLIELTNADEAYVTQLTGILAPCILRPKQETGLSMTEKYNVRLLRDLLAHKDSIFGELKRQSSLAHSSSGATRPNRAISTDESSRRENMIERQRAIAAATQSQSQGLQRSNSNRSRQPSPGPSTRVPLPEVSGHRRDRSRGPETRFPISTGSVTSPTENRVMSPSSASTRLSLEVPLSPPMTRQTQPTTTQESPPSQLRNSTEAPETPETPPKSNGSLHQPPPAEPSADEKDSTRARSDTGSSLRSYTPLGISQADTDSSSSPTTTVSDSQSNRDSVPAKRDSLTRSGAARGQFQRKGTGSLQRQSVQSVMSKRDSNAPIASTPENFVQSPVDVQSGEPEPASKGVQLEDKPMDFD